jgi:hypothetical protein
MRNKFVLFVLLFIFSLALVPSLAAEKQANKASGKTLVKTVNCWKRTWVTSEALLGKSTMPVCKAFEEVLNATREPPDELRCNWTLPAGEKRFKKLMWEPLDPKEYWGLIEDIVLSGWAEKYRAGQWERLEPEYRKKLEEGKINLTVSSVDLDSDGTPERLVRYNWISDCRARGVMGVMNPETRRLDWRFRQLLLGPNSDEGAEIMLYNGEAYMFGWESAWKILMVYWGMSSSINVCQFKYIKEDKP